MLENASSHDSTHSSSWFFEFSSWKPMKVHCRVCFCRRRKLMSTNLKVETLKGNVGQPQPLGDGHTVCIRSSGLRLGQPSSGYAGCFVCSGIRKSWADLLDGAAVIDVQIVTWQVDQSDQKHTSWCSPWMPAGWIAAGKRRSCYLLYHLLESIMAAPFSVDIIGKANFS